MIEIIHTRENDDDFTVFFAIDIEDEYYDFHADIPKDKDQQKWLEDNQDFIRFLILGKMYPDADWQRYKTEEDDNYSALKKWIAVGCQNQVLIGYDEKEKPIYELKTTEKQPWRSTHPPGLALTAEVDQAATLEDLKTIVKKAIIV